MTPISFCNLNVGKFILLFDNAPVNICDGHFDKIGIQYTTIIVARPDTGRALRDTDIGESVIWVGKLHIVKQDCEYQRPAVFHHFFDFPYIRIDNLPELSHREFAVTNHIRVTTGTVRRLDIFKYHTGVISVGVGVAAAKRLSKYLVYIIVRQYGLDHLSAVPHSTLAVGPDVAGRRKGDFIEVVAVALHFGTVRFHHANNVIGDIGKLLIR